MRAAVLPLLLVAALALAGCGGSSHSSAPGAGSSAPAPGAGGSASQIEFAKTRFGLHAGLAFGVFHRWIYKPFKTGVLRYPVQQRLAFLTAIAAAGVVIHEIRLARADAQQSPRLARVRSPLRALGAAVALTYSGLQSRRVYAEAIGSANASIRRAHAASRAAGQPVSETTAGTGL